MKKVNPPGNEPPIFDLHAFGKKASVADFYIQTLHEHLKQHKFVNKPHKHDFYLILYITKGRGTHTIDFQEYPIKEGSVFLMTPGQVHAWELDPETEGVIIFFTKGFYQMQLSENNLLEFPFYHSLSASPLISIEEDEVIDFVFQQMQQEFLNTDKPELRLLRSYLDLLLLKLSQYFSQSPEFKSGTATYKLRKLEQLIERNFKTLHQPADYAERMNISAAHLNAICKSNLGKTLSELIQQRIVLEAKRLFAYADLNVNEIASKLGFADGSYFIRFFKKHVGMTPDAFRNTLQHR